MLLIMKMRPEETRKRPVVEFHAEEGLDYGDVARYFTLQINPGSGERCTCLAAAIATQLIISSLLVSIRRCESQSFSFVGRTLGLSWPLFRRRLYHTIIETITE